MGLDDPRHPEVAAAAERALAAARAAGKLVGVFCGSTAERDAYAAAGVNWFVFGSDQAFMRQGAAAAAHPGA
jgi:2-keto-3-deoxy-L-rhamnonate aldolase RhmA